MSKLSEATDTATLAVAEAALAYCHARHILEVEATRHRTKTTEVFAAATHVVNTYSVLSSRCEMLEVARLDELAYDYPTDGADDAGDDERCGHCHELLADCYCEPRDASS